MAWIVELAERKFTQSIWVHNKSCINYNLLNQGLLLKQRKQSEREREWVPWIKTLLFLDLAAFLVILSFDRNFAAVYVWNETTEDWAGCRFGSYGWEGLLSLLRQEKSIQQTSKLDVRIVIELIAGVFSFSLGEKRKHDRLITFSGEIW